MYDSFLPLVLYTTCIVLADLNKLALRFSVGMSLAFAMIQLMNGQMILGVIGGIFALMGVWYECLNSP